MRQVTDPDILTQLNGQAPKGLTPVTDPDVLAQLTTEDHPLSSYNEGGAAERFKATYDPNKDIKTLGKAALNFVPDAGTVVVETGKGVYNAVRHPVDTAQNLINTGKQVKDIAGGLGSKTREALGGTPTATPEEQAAADGALSYLRENLTADNLRNYVAEHPAHALITLGGLLTGGGSLVKGAGKLTGSEALVNTGKAVSDFGLDVSSAPFSAPYNVAKSVTSKLPKKASAGNLAASVLGTTTGAGPEAIKRAYKGGDEFVGAMRGGTSSEDILNNAQDALNLMKSERGSKYAEKLAAIGQNGKSIEITPVRQKLDELLKQYRIGTDPETGTLDFRHATLDPKESKAVTEIVDRVKGWGLQKGDRTPLGLDSLKQQLDNFYTENSKTKAFVTQLRNSVKDALVKAVPEYGDMTAEYGQTSGLIKEIERALSLKNTAMADTAIKKLQSTMRENFEFRRDLLGKLEKTSGQDIGGQIAGQALSGIVPKGGLAKILAAGGAESALLMHSPQIAALLALSSPRAVGEFVNFVGNAARAAKTVKGYAAKKAGVGALMTGEANNAMTNRERAVLNSNIPDADKERFLINIFKTQNKE